MTRVSRLVIPLFLGVIFLGGVPAQEGKKFSIKTGTAPAPKELSEPIQKLLSSATVQLLDAAGKPICDIWFRQELATDATPEQIKSGVTFREVKQSEILGAVQFHVHWSDYRKQKIKAGVYTMRLAYQPTDGKHTADVSDFQEFALLISAKADTKPALLEMKMLHDRSGDSLDLGHPGVFMLWPVSKIGKEPTLEARAKNHWVINSSCKLTASGKSAGAIGIGVTIVGHSPAE